MKENPRLFPKEPVLKEADCQLCRWRLTVRGIVQGVGFRPFVYNTAQRLGLAGWVKNTSGQVEILLEGRREQLESFVHALQHTHPPQARIDALEAVELKAGEPPLADFQIIASTAEESVRPIIPADLALCEACRAEIHTPTERRYRYPFTNCTHCGPRWSIIRGLPYDRPRTSMAHFAMCPDCQAEYKNPRDRRFHAQPIACPWCGPKLRLLVRVVRTEPECSSSSPQEDTSPEYLPVAEGDDALQQAAQAILEGKILALKGLGGFQLLCDATRQEVVQELRRRKRRPDKPFALMFANLDQVRQACWLSELEAQLLQSPESPIVLLRRRAPLGTEVRRPDVLGVWASGPHSPLPSAGEAGQPIGWPGEGALQPSDTSACQIDSAGASAWQIAGAVAPGNPYLGVMLPYTPLHELLMEAVGRPIICTSGNLSEEPMAYRTAEAISRLGQIADLILTHNRPIVRPVDDSVVRVLALPPELAPQPVSQECPPGKDEIQLAGQDAQPAAWENAKKPAAALCRHPAGQEAQPAGGQGGLGRQQTVWDVAGVPVGSGRQLIQVLRRARGYAPRPIELGFQMPTILALGGHLKNTVALSLGSQVVLSQHVGDLDNLPSLEVFHQTVEDLLQFFRAEPELLVCDLHPDYASTQYAEQLADRLGVPLLRVQHHEAHLAACLAEQGLSAEQLDEPILGFCWDGTGYGWDGTIWGGEILLWQAGRVVRVGSLWPFPLPGGDQAVRQPRRSALGVLYELLGESAWERIGPLQEWFSPTEQAGLRSMLRRRVNSPRTSSMGRLFDAIAALCGLGSRISFEGQAAMALEFAALEEPTELPPQHLQGLPTPANPPFQPLEPAEPLLAYPLPWIEGAEQSELPKKITGKPPQRDNAPLGLLDWRPMVEAVLTDRAAGVPVGQISRGFHAALAEGILQAAQWAAVHWGVAQVALSGGCFQNSLLTQWAYHRLRQPGFTVFLHQQTPPGDGGIALGQILLAACQHVVSC